MSDAATAFVDDSTKPPPARHPRLLRQPRRGRAKRLQTSRPSTTSAEIAVIVPAHNEMRDIEHTLDSLLRQTLPPGRLIVVSDNSTDATPNLARKYAAQGVEVIRTVNNGSKKAGALNTGIRSLCSNDGTIPATYRYVFTMDADTELEEHFLERAARHLDRHPEQGGVSAACRGRDTPVKVDGGPFPLLRRLFYRWLIMMQHIEYDRFTYMRALSYIHTMCGAGSLYCVEALNTLLAYREVYDPRPDNLVEDYELTVELKMHGWKVTANERLIAYTDLMPNLGMLLRQRLRWSRGTIRELRVRGWNKATWYTRLQVRFGVVTTPVYYLMLAVWASVMVRDGVSPYSFVVLTSISLLYAWAIRHLGWRYILLEALILPELLYGIIRYYWFMNAVILSRSSHRNTWG